MRGDRGSPDTSLVKLLVSQPGMIDRLAPEHLPRDDGRCKTCKSGGDEADHDVWPCPIAEAIAVAREELRRRRESSSALPRGEEHRPGTSGPDLCAASRPEPGGAR